MNIIVRFYLLGQGIPEAPLQFDAQTAVEDGDPGQLDFSKTEPSGHLVTIGVL